MAWGNMVDLGWRRAFVKNKYEVQNYIKYQIDYTNRQIRVECTKSRVKGTSSIYTYWGPTNNGYQFVGGTKGNYRKCRDAWDYLKSGNIYTSTAGWCEIPSGSMAAKNRVIDCIYPYNTDGSLPTINLSTQMIFGLSNYSSWYAGRSVTSYWGWPQQDWHAQNIAGWFPKIGKKQTSSSSSGNTGTTTTEEKVADVTNLSVKNVAADNATIYYIGNHLATKYQISWSNGSDSGSAETANAYYTIRNLKAGNTYTVKVVSVDKSGNKTSGISINVTTAKHATVYVNQNGTKKKGYLWINDGGTKKKALAIWVNVNGEAKKAVNL